MPNQIKPAIMYRKDDRVKNRITCRAFGLPGGILELFCDIHLARLNLARWPKLPQPRINSNSSGLPITIL